MQNLTKIAPSQSGRSVLTHRQGYLLTDLTKYKTSLKKINQLIVVQVIRSHFAILRAYERSCDSWIHQLGPFDVVIGKNGATEDKCEGDEKTPIGLYSLPTLFGSKNHRTQKMPFISVHEHLEAIDDSDSKYYNTIVDRRILEIDWKSSENMKDFCSLY